MQTLPSRQRLALPVWTHPTPVLQESFVHGLLSLQFRTPVPGWQNPLAQASPVVHGFPSEQGAEL